MDKNTNEKLDRKLPVNLPSVKNYSSRKEWESACWQKILKSEKLLDLFITPDERHDLIMRIAAMEGLSSGKKYRQIGEELLLSQQTISAIKKVLMGKTYQSYNKQSNTERKKKTYGVISNPNRKPWSNKVRRRTKFGTVYFPRQT